MSYYVDKVLTRAVGQRRHALNCKTFQQNFYRDFPSV